MFPVVIGNGRCMTKDTVISGYKIPAGVSWYEFIFTNGDERDENSPSELAPRIMRCSHPKHPSLLLARLWTHAFFLPLFSRRAYNLLCRVSAASFELMHAADDEYRFLILLHNGEGNRSRNSFQLDQEKKTHIMKKCCIIACTDKLSFACTFASPTLLGLNETRFLLESKHSALCVFE